MLFVLLDPGADVLAARVAERQVQKTHFMPATLLASQLATLRYNEGDWYMHVHGDPYPTVRAMTDTIMTRLDTDGLLPGQD